MADVWDENGRPVGRPYDMRGAASDAPTMRDDAQSRYPETHGHASLGIINNLGTSARNG